MEPITRQEQLLDSIATGNSVELEPITREEQYLSAIAGLTDFIPEKPITRKEMFYQKILESGVGGGGGSNTLKNIVAPTDVTGLERVVAIENEGQSMIFYRVADFVPFDRYKGCEILWYIDDPSNPPRWTTGGEEGTTAKLLDTGSYLDVNAYLIGVSQDNETIEIADGMALTFQKTGIYFLWVNDLFLVQEVVFAENNKPEEPIELSYTLNKNGTYIPIDESKDSVFPSGEWYSKFVFVSDKIYTVDELLGCIITTKELYLGTGSDQPLTVKNVEITSDLIMEIGNGTFAVMDSSGFPLLAAVTEEMAGVEISEGFALPSNAGTYLVYIDKNPDKQGYVFGSVSVKKPLGKPYIDTSAITDFSNFGAKDRINGLVSSLDTSNGTNFAQMFYMCTNLTRIPQLDTSNGASFRYMFFNCTALTTIPLLDLSRATDMYGFLQNCTSLKTLTLSAVGVDLNTSTFQNCTALESLTIPNGWRQNIYLHYSNNLTVESLHGMIENLADLTGQTAKTFQIGATNLAKIDEEHIAMLQAKNWNYS